MSPSDDPGTPSSAMDEGPSSRVRSPFRVLRSVSVFLANLCWFLAGIPAWLRFRLGREDLAATQAAVLRRILAWNRDSAYGRKHDFPCIGDVETFRRRVPLVDWSDVEPWVRRICAGEQGLLTAAPVLMVEPTSGSSSRPKYVPYTEALRGEFQEAVGAWMVDLFLHHPRLFLGSAYWCVTPLAARERRTAGGLPVGFEEDGEYFGPLRRWLLETLLVVPKELALVEGTEVFRYVTLLFLLAARDLALISVWSPTFLSSLMRPLAGWIDRLAGDLEAGRISPPGPMDEALATRLAGRLGRHPERAAEIRRIAELHDGGEGLAQALWPNLVLVSAWADATAADWVAPLRRLFPAAAFQPKGLLATEGITTFPLASRPEGGALACHAHFYEFLEAGGESRLAHELAPKGTYEVVLTTGGGLYRYRTGDRVRVTGHVGHLPLLRFLGRAGAVSDHFGEKLSEAAVREALEGALRRFGLARPPFWLVALECDDEPPAYVLWWEGKDLPGKDFARALEEGLRANPHYDGCRRLGQLGPLALRSVRPEGGWEGVLRRSRAEGMREGDVKPRLLDPRRDWTPWLG